jgi:hypothetical protein
MPHDLEHTRGGGRDAPSETLAGEESPKQGALGHLLFVLELFMEFL